MTTEKLYYEDSHLREFDAQVVSCEERNGRIAVELDRTAFFPEGGGQKGDVGTLNGVSVLDTHLVGESVLHYTEKPLPVGEKVHGTVDWETRFPRMQSHTAEHIVSGIVNRRFGFANVGFHMGADGVIVDFDGFIPPETLCGIEAEANRVIWENRSVTARFPSPEELSTLNYRSKKELTGAVRLVEVEGVDLCACCAPHVKRTGEVGAVKFLESIRRKDGVRIWMLAGKAAYEDYRAKSQSVSEISALLSAKPELVSEAVRRVLAERDGLQYAAGGLKRELIRFKTAGLPRTEGNRVFFEPSFTAEEAKLLCEAALPATGGMAAVFFGEEGAYRCCIMSENVDLREKSREINTVLRGKGGGSPALVSGSVTAARSEIEAYFGVQNGRETP